MFCEFIARFCKQGNHSFVNPQQPNAEAENSKENAEKKPKVVRVNEPTQLLQQDWREFTCTTWHLEPTVRYSCLLTSHLLAFSHLILLS